MTITLITINISLTNTAGSNLIMEELSDDEIWFIRKFILQEEQGAGRLVKHNKSGTMGRIFNHHQMVNGKYQVYLVDGTKMLCAPENLTLKGFID